MVDPDDAVYRKIAWRIVPFLFVCYVVNFIDRVNIGFAKLQFLQDLHIDDAAYGLAAGMFFVGYVLFEMPSNLMLGRIGARKTMLRIMTLWGILTILMAFATHAAMLYGLRFLIGAAEAGFFPGVILYLTYWFPNRRRGRVTSLFIMAVPIAGIIGGPLSGSIMSTLHDVGGLHGWQWLFIIEGIPAVLLGVLALFCLHDRPAQAAWLSVPERARVLADLERDQAARQDNRVAQEAFSAMLRSPIIYLLCGIYFTIFCFLNAVGFWVPTILHEVGTKSVATIGWVAGGISVLAALGVVVVGRSSDRTMERRWHTTICGFTAAASFLLLPLTAHSPAGTALLLTVAEIGIYGGLSVFWTIPTAYFGGQAAAGGLALITTIGAIGGAMSPWIVGRLRVMTGNLYAGLDVIALLLVLGMLVLLWCMPRTRLAPPVRPVAGKLS